MGENTYIVATIRPWNIKTYHEVISRYPGRWLLVTAREELSPHLLKRMKPRYVFFPHWSFIVPAEVLKLSECVCFHETDVPYGRGGSPIQNLIARGHRKTVITALRMVDTLDAGPVLMKRPMSLEGIAEEIFIRAARTVAEMIREIIENEPEAQPQKGRPTVFRRRKPAESAVPETIGSLQKLFDHIRMLDAAEYPRAYIEHDGFRYELSRPSLRTDAIEADVRITKIKK